MSRSIARWSCGISLKLARLNLGLHTPWRLALLFAPVLRVPKLYEQSMRLNCCRTVSAAGIGSSVSNNWFLAPSDATGSGGAQCVSVNLMGRIGGAGQNGKAECRVEALADEVHHRVAQVEIDRHLRRGGKEFRQQGREVQHAERDGCGYGEVPCEGVGLSARCLEREQRQ
jgi:hypothetical protein